MVYYIVLTLFVTVAVVVLLLSFVFFARVELVNGSIFNLTNSRGKPWGTYLISQRCPIACHACPVHMTFEEE